MHTFGTHIRVNLNWFVFQWWWEICQYARLSAVRMQLLPSSLVYLQWQNWRCIPGSYAPLCVYIASVGPGGYGYCFIRVVCNIIFRWMSKKLLAQLTMICVMTRCCQSDWNFVSGASYSNTAVLLWVMFWHQTDDKPSTEPVLTWYHIWVSRSKCIIWQLCIIDTSSQKMDNLLYPLKTH